MAWHGTVRGMQAVLHTNLTSVLLYMYGTILMRILGALLAVQDPARVAGGLPPQLVQRAAVGWPAGRDALEKGRRHTGSAAAAAVSKHVQPQ
eukprot:SAG22_NODE_910_length_6547_cov_2.044975_5_plen_92_part_00